MTLHTILVLLSGFGVHLVSCTNYPILPSIVVYEGKNQTGESVFVPTTYFPDLSVKKFDNRVQSVCVNGTWLLYEHSHYNTKEMGDMEYVSGYSYCSNLKIIEGKASSLRFVGSATDTASDSITFYSNIYFQGKEEYFTDSDASLNNDVRNSIIVTGSLGWRLFEKSNFQGESICIQAEKKSSPTGIVNEPFVFLNPNVKTANGDSPGIAWPVMSFRKDSCFESIVNHD